MKQLVILLAGAALGFAGTAATAKTTLAERGEARLAKMLEGRVAGEPSRCIQTFRNNGTEVIDQVALVHREGKTIWVARPANPRTLDRDDVLLIKRFSPSTLCASDTIRTLDRTGGYVTGVVFLKDFVPYTKEG